MSDWHNDNWNGNSAVNVPVEVIPRPIRRVIRFSIRFYILMACIGAFLWGTYAGIQAIRRLSANTRTPQTSAPRSAQSTKGHRF